MNDTGVIATTSGTAEATAVQTVPVAPETPAPMTAEQKKQAKKELRLAVKKLRARAGNEWNGLVGAFNDRALQVKVASVVWWDFFSNRNITKRWEELDEFLVDAFNPELPEPSVEALKNGLIAVGYPPALAEKRSQGSD